jgi:hypothetical protein
MRIRTVREMMLLDGFEERYRYLKLRGGVGHQTFGSERHLNQRFYTSREWRNIRHQIIARDLGCDMAVQGYDIHDKIIIHHMNPIMVDDLIDGNEDVLNPDYLVCVSHKTHNAIHFGDETPLEPLVERRPGDTKPW